MAAPTEKHGEEISAQNDPQNEDVPPDLDVMSPNFDPLKALYSSTVVLPVPSATCFNNLGEYESFTTGRGRGKGRGQSDGAQRRRRVGLWLFLVIKITSLRPGVLKPT